MKSIIEDFAELGNKLSELEGKPKAEPSGASKLCPQCHGRGKYIVSVTMGMPQWAHCEYCLVPPSQQAPMPPLMRQVRKFCTNCLGAGGLCRKCKGKGYHEVAEPVPPSYSHYQGGAPAAPDPSYGSAPGVAIWQCSGCGNSDFTDRPSNLRQCNVCGFVHTSHCLNCNGPRVGLATDGSAYICHDCGYWQ